MARSSAALPVPADTPALSPDVQEGLARNAITFPDAIPGFKRETVLAAIAAITVRIRLSAIVIAPLRPAVFLAKQLATLDVGVPAHGVAQEVVHAGHGLDAREPSARHHQRQ